MDYQEALEYLESTVWFGINPGLERIEALTSLHGRPQDSYPVIQITGTNGKTSTTWFLVRILEAHGLKTGAYTSPHLESYTERYTIGADRISEKAFAALLTLLVPSLAQASERDLGEITHFEVLTAMAYLFFRAERVDAAVVEVGMGGRWDATSVVRPKAAVITNVSLDHTDRLGETLGEIAAEKADIIKEGVPAVCGPLPAPALQAVAKRCERMGSPLALSGEDFRILDTRLEEGAQFSVEGRYGTYQDLEIVQPAYYQVENAALAIAAAEIFLNKALRPELVKKALMGAVSPGRLESVRQRPLIVLDGAHNPAGMLRLVESIGAGLTFRRLVVVLAVLEDKDIDGILRVLLPHVSMVIATENRFYRSARAAVLAECIKRLDAQVSLEEYGDLREAVKRALGAVSEEDLLLITGSLYTVGEARSILVDHLVEDQPRGTDSAIAETTWDPDRAIRARGDQHQ